MFNVTGPQAVTALNRTDDSNLYLRVNQRVAGEVLQVSNGQVVISIQGVPIVAKLSTPDQAALLSEQKFAQFIVKEFTPNSLVLQLQTQNTQMPTSANNPIQQDTLLVETLLNQMKLPLNAENRAAVAAALEQNLPVSPELINELKTGFTSIPAWGAQHANASAQLKSLGLSISPEAIRLIMQPDTELGNALSNVVKLLQSAVQQSGLDPHVSREIRSTLQTMQNIIIPGDLNSQALAQKIQDAISVLGSTLEYEVLAKLVQGKDVGLENGMINLARLRGSLNQPGLQSLAEGIDRFMDKVRLVQLMNTQTEKTGVQNSWTQVELPVQYPPAVIHSPNQTGETETAFIKIARNDGQEGSGIDSRYTQIVIQMDINENQKIRVNLSLVNKDLGIAVTASDRQVAGYASDELPGLIDALTSLGFNLRQNRVTVGDLEKEPVSKNHQPADQSILVNVKV